MKKILLTTLVGILACGIYSSAENFHVNKDLSSFSYNWHPYLSVKPTKYWDCENVLQDGERNTVDILSPRKGLRNHLLTQSTAGLVHRACQEGKTKVSIWMGAGKEYSGYIVSHDALGDLGIQSLGQINTLDLLTNTYGTVDGVDTDVRHLIDGYILVDLVNNPESNVVASTASHVYNGVIVDIRDKEIFDKAGYKMLYDATKKTTVDSWREFRDKCNNNALVLMPVNTGELREFAIANNLFVINLNHFYADKSRGDNFELFEEVLAWLKPNSPVYGWDQGIDENKIADCISRWGNQALPYDWGYNTTMTSVIFPERQDYKRCNNIDPREIDYSSDKKFVSYYLTDGDNIQWMLNGFSEKWYQHPMSIDQKMTYGVALSNTTQIAPSQMEYIINKQHEDVSLFNRCSYFFIDTYAVNKDRIQTLKQLAEAEAKHMQMHGNKILGTVTHYDAATPEAMEAYQIIIDANDELEGIISIQYSPYADGEGRVFWFKNKKGYDIPVVCTKYSIWNTGTINHQFEGSPAFIARKLKEDNSKHALVCVHCWSMFSDQGTTTDEVAENISKENMTVHSAGAAELCTRRLGKDFQLCNTQELIWRIRMEHNPKNTKKALRNYKK